MNIKHNRNSSIFFMTIVIGLFFTMLYYTYSSYVKYDKQADELEEIVLIEKINSTLNDIDKERTYSAIYMGTNHKEDLQRLKESRELVNRKIDDISKLLSLNNIYTIHKPVITNISTTLSYSRDRVNVLSMNYNHILFENYIDKVVEPLMGILNHLTEESSLSKDYFQFVLDNENIYSEKSFISFILSGQKVMNNKDLTKWETIIDKDSTTKANLNNLRGKILIGSVSGKYDISLKDWINTNIQKINDIKKREQLAILEVQNTINNKLESSKYTLIQYALLSITFLTIFIMILYLYTKSAKDSRFLIDTLSDLESDLNANQREEIKRVLKKKDTLAIYKFLVNAIKEPNRAKDHFLANMSHEIRTPLNGIIGFTNILKETELKEDQQEFLSIIEESSNNLISIVNDILDFSKVASGKIEIENIAFNVMEKFEVSIDSYAAKAAQKNINLNLMIDPNLPMELMGDAPKISQVIINLLSNAVKFTDEGGVIDIIIEQLFEDDNVVKLKFSIKDSGIGMSLEQQAKVFDAFSQADVSTSRKFGGTGLGLTISKKFISLMGGELELTSKEGEGTTFFFSLSLKKSPNSSQRETLGLTNINAIYVTRPDKAWMSDNIKSYIEYNGANFRTVNYVDVLAMKRSELADILFIDHQYIEDEGIIESLLELDTKTIFISTTEIESCKCPLKKKISKVIYKPMNFSKTVRSLTTINKKVVPENSNIEEINNISSTSIFTNISALIVEDNVINQKLLDRILSNFDIDVTIASNGLEAVDLRQKNSYDIIFMDIQMPVMDGVEATKKIIEYEKENNLTHIPIVALTANVLTSDRNKYLESGMDEYLKKPIDVADLTTIIEEYFPIEEIRKSMPVNIENNFNSNVILYKETPLTAKIYTAVLNNLGYHVDMYSSANEFIENIEKQTYKFALFDSMPFKNINSENFVVELIRDSGATPIAFVDKKDENTYCETLNSVGHANEISEKLLAYV